MSAVHDRWELVEPLLLTHTLRDPTAFRDSTTKCSPTKVLDTLRREHQFEEDALARALDLLGEAAPPLFSGEQPIHAAIRETSARWLVADGDHWCLRVEGRQPGHEIIRWRGVTMLVPPSIIIAGALSATERSHPRWVQVLPNSIAPRESVGHLHVHLGPMLPFEALWLQLWKAFLLRGALDARNGNGIASMKEKDVPVIGQHTSKRQPGIRWQWMLELAFAARVWLSLEDEHAPLPSPLRAFSRGKIDLERRASALLSLWSQNGWPHPAPQNGWRTRARRDARGLARSHMQEERRSLRGRAAEARAPTDADNEVLFLAAALRRCADNESYARVLYQYLRIKVALYSHLVVDPWTPGLRHFLDVVQHDSPYSDVIDDRPALESIRLAAAQREQPLRLDSLEIHIPPSTWLKRARPRDERDRHAWVLSFVRAKPPKADDPDGTRAAAQWRRAAFAAGTTCRILARRMAVRPSVLRELRGISLMDWERNGPVWLFHAAFRRLLDASAEVASGHPSLRLRPLHTAFHLGEDFDHLLSGMRQIFEPLEWNLIRRGDRIGHALALGLSPEAWCERTPWVRMRPWDQILDIGFVYTAFEKFDLQLAPDALDRMRANAREAVDKAFGLQDANALETARDIWQSLPRFTPKVADDSPLPADRSARARALVARVLDHRRTGRAALALSLPVETKHDLPVLNAVHDFLMKLVAKWQVAVEVNPSSNLLVGGFRSIFHQPAFHADDLPMTLNADDPLTFATTLADEYAYAWAGMVIGSGTSPHQATRRLEEAARCSMRYAFTSPSPEPDEESPGTRRGNRAPRGPARDG